MNKMNGTMQSGLPAGGWTGTMDISYAYPRRVSKRKWWSLPVFFLRHRLHSQLVSINGGKITVDMTACPRCGVFVANNGTQSGTITIKADKA